MKSVFRLLLLLSLFSSCSKTDDIVHVAAPPVPSPGCYAVLHGTFYNGDTIRFPIRLVSVDSATGILGIRLIDNASSSPYELDLYTRKRIAGYDTLMSHTATFENRFYDGYLADGVVLHIVYFGPPGGVVSGTYSGRMINPAFSDTLQISGAFEATRSY